mgnify:CR=1 FL=1
MAVREMKNKIIIGILIILFYGCQNENNPCEVAKEGENYVLSDSAKTYVSNYFNADRIIFKTIDGDEVAFDVIAKDTIGSYQVGFPCEVDTSKVQLTHGTSQIIVYSLTNDAVIPKPLQVSLYKFPALPTQQTQESLVVSLGKYLSNSFSDGDLLFDYNFNNTNTQLNYLDSLLIAGKTFYSVFETNYSPYIPKLKIKYSKNEGVVYIKDSQSLVEYIYERKE